MVYTSIKMVERDEDGLKSLNEQTDYCITDPESLKSSSPTSGVYQLFSFSKPFLTGDRDEISKAISDTTGKSQ